MSSKHGTIIKLYILLIIFVNISYLPYFIECLVSGRAITYSYVMNMSAPSAFAEKFTLFKDILAFGLLILLSKERRMIPFYMLIFYSVIVLLIEYIFHNEGIVLSIFAGVRSLMYFVVTKNICMSKVTIDEYQKIDRLFLACIIVQFVTVIIQFGMSGASIQSLGYKTTRFMGLMPSSGNLGAYCIGASLIVGICYRISKIINLRKFIFFTAMIMFMTIAVGSRGAVVQCGIILASALLDTKKADTRTKIFLGGVLLVIISIFLLGFMEEQAGRGDVMLSGAGRITAFMDVIKDSNLFQIIFGHGLGKGTTALVNLGGSSLIVDTTISTLLYQFGIIITIYFVFEYFRHMIKLIKRFKFSLFIIGCSVSISSFFFSGIPLDQVAFVIMFTYSLERLGTVRYTSGCSTYKRIYEHDYTFKPAS